MSKVLIPVVPFSYETKVTPEFTIQVLPIIVDKQTVVLLWASLPYRNSYKPYRYHNGRVMIEL